MFIIVREGGGRDIGNVKLDYTRRETWLLFYPVTLELGLIYLTGFMDFLTAAQVSEAAVSGISPVYFSMALTIAVFTATSTGGSVAVGQYLRARELQSNQGKWMTARVIMKAM